MTDDLDRRLAALSPEQRARFDELLAQRAEAEDVFPLSVLQRGTWFLEQLRPRNPGYIVPGAVRVEGPLDTAVLRTAVAEIVRRHEALRTVFELRDGAPAQVVRHHMTVDVPETDLSGDEFTDADRQKRIDDALAEPFDIDTGPLLRVRLLRTGPQESVLVVAMHHLVSDRWSTAVFLSELSELYEAFTAGLPSPLPEPEIQYGDFAAWQQRQLEEDGWEKDLAYWRDHLAGAPPVLSLPTDRPRPAVQGFNGASVPIDLPPALIGDLSALAGRHGATPYMALLAVFQILLHRYSGQDDIVVGVPTALRGQAEVEPLIGYFVNTLPIRTDLGGDPAFVPVLTRVRDACMGAYAHQDVPFELIVADLNTPRDLSRPPVYQVSFSYGREPVPHSAMAGARLTRLPVRSEGARFDLELQAFDSDGGLTGWFEYDRDLFDETTVVRLAGHFRRLAEQVVAHPDAPVAGLDLLDAAERRRVLTDWNATEHAVAGQRLGAPARRGAGPAAARGGSRPPRRPEPHLRRAQPPRQPARPSAAPARRRPERPRRRRHGTLPRPGRGPAGDPQGRRGVRPARPGPAGRAPGRHRRGRPAAGAAHPRLGARPAARRELPRPGHGGPGGAARRRAGRRPRRGGGRRGPGVRDLHLRLDRPPQGRHERARGASATACCGCRTPTGSTPPTASCRRRRSPSTCRCGSSSGR